MLNVLIGRAARVGADLVQPQHCVRIVLTGHVVGADEMPGMSLDDYLEQLMGGCRLRITWRVYMPGIVWQTYVSQVAISAPSSMAICVAGSSRKAC